MVGLVAFLGCSRPFGPHTAQLAVSASHLKRGGSSPTNRISFGLISHYSFIGNDLKPKEPMFDELVSSIRCYERNIVKHMTLSLMYTREAEYWGGSYFFKVTYIVIGRTWI